MRRQNSETSLRYIALLRCIPPYPKKVSVTQIGESLKELSTEYDVNIRTIQRDLEKLTGYFPIACDTEGRKNLWFWANKHDLLDIPEMGQHTALAFNLAEDHLSTLLPASTLTLLAAYFNRAREVLKGSKFAKWSRNIRAIPRGPVLEAPRITPAVQEAVYDALLNEWQLEVAYRPRNADRDKEYVLNPLGLVSRNGAMYLVATAWGYTDPRHFMLSRVRKANVMTERTRQLPNFNLDTYIHEQGEFAYPHSPNKLELELLFTEDAGFQFSEFKLSPDQTVTLQEDGEVLVTATVRDDAEIRWWLRSFGDEMEVIKPDSLREEFREMAKNLNKAYM